LPKRIATTMPTAATPNGTVAGRDSPYSQHVTKQAMEIGWPRRRDVMYSLSSPKR